MSQISVILGAILLTAIAAASVAIVNRAIQPICPRCGAKGIHKEASDGYACTECGLPWPDA